MSKISIEQAVTERILILDGGLGTMIQQYKLTEEDYRSTHYADTPYKLLGCNEVLVKSAPNIIAEIHEQYLQAGADIISTDTFNANSVSLIDYGVQDEVYELNFLAAKLAKDLAERYTLLDSSKPRFVAGSIGPTNRTASISSDINNPASRSISFDELVDSYYTQAKGLADGGADIFLIETIFDTLNAKAAIFAINKLSEARGAKIPLMISGTLTDKSGRTLSGQTLEAFYNSVIYAKPLSIGLNCSFGAAELQSYVSELSTLASCNVSAHPNAGLPNLMGEYDQDAETMGELIDGYLKDGSLNIVGGCCGTTPEHIRKIAERVKNYTPRPIPTEQKTTTLSGLESLYIKAETNFVNVGERANVAGSAKFARLIREQKYDEALAIVRSQVEAGAQIVDVCMDDGLLDAEREMVNFLNYIISDPEISRVPLMIDSSSWSVLESGLKCVQGKSIVNSISLKEGEKEFLHHAKLINNYGAAAVVMLFDEKGQADTFERKIEVAKRAYELLTSNGFPAENIIFDPNVLSVATGIEEHESYGIDFIRACGWIKENLPYAKVSGGVSNLSFSFRGNNKIREAMHSVFLYHAIKEGMDMAIVNPAMLQIYSDIPADLLELCEDVVLNRRKDATERLTEYANHTINAKGSDNVEKRVEEWRNNPVEERISYALIKGNTEYIDKDTLEVYNKINNPIKVIDNVLMPAMEQIGELFASGKMFLPQVVKSARVMKSSVAILTPFIEAQNSGEATHNGRVLMATVKGDVHDIGKNIVSVVMTCNGYLIDDLGVMTETDDIVNKAQEWGADAIGLSGLITPSLEQMCNVLKELQRRGLKTPVMIGGATTSELHTAVKLAPVYDGVVIHCTDASKNILVLSKLLSANADEYITDIKSRQEELRKLFYEREAARELKSLIAARADAFKCDFSNIIAPNVLGKTHFADFPIDKVEEFINWTQFFAAWGLRGGYPQVLSSEEYGEEATKLFADAQQLLQRVKSEKIIKLCGTVAIYPALSVGDNIIIISDEKGGKTTLPQLRNQQQNREVNISLADFISPNGDDYIGAFALTAGVGLKEREAELKAANDDYHAIMLKLLADRLAEAFAECVHKLVRQEIWGFQTKEFTLKGLFHGDYQGIRAAFGYPSCPDHSLKREVFELLDIEKDTPMELTENFMISPGESICGLIFANADSKFFELGKISPEQLNDYSQRRGFKTEEISKIIKSL
ncbi:MAG: methionine synthase [Bacteroidales bacterium]